MRNPTWLDMLVQQTMDKKGTAEDVAKAVASSTQFIQAIKAGMGIEIPSGVMGLSKAQMVSDKIVDSLKESL